MASPRLRPPQFSEDVAWLPCWLQNLRTDGSNEFVKDSQAHSNQEVKDPASSQENGSDGKYINVLSREDCGYKSCHLLLSAEDSSPISFATPENVFHFNLHLSSDVDSLIFPTQDFNAFHDVVSPSKICSLQPVQASIGFVENMSSIADHHAYEQNLLPALVPETVKMEASKSLIDTNDSISQQEEKSSKCFTSDCISNAIEFSIAASEALAIHDLVKMESVSEKMHTENVLEVALCVKQARLEWLNDGIHSSSEDSSCSDSLSDLNDLIMEEAYEDVGLLSSVPSAENYSRCNKRQSDKQLTSQLPNFRKSEEKQLEFNIEMEMQQKAYSPLDSLCCEREMHFDAPDLGTNTPNHFENGLPISHFENARDLGLTTPKHFENAPDSGSNTPKLSSVPRAENYSTCNKKQSDIELTSQLANFGKSEEKQLEFNVEMEMRQKAYSPLDSLCYEREMHCDAPDLGSNSPKRFENGLPIPHHFVQNNSNALVSNQWALPSLPPSWKELDPSSLNWNNADWIPKFHIRETSFLTESVDVVPDESSCVQKHDPKCAVGSQLCMHSESVCLHNKPDEAILHSQDVVRCSNLSLIDPLCSVVPCSISSEHGISNTDIEKEHYTENFVSSISEFEMDNFQKISDKNATFDCRDEHIATVLDSKDIPVTATNMAKQIPKKLPRVEHIDRKQLDSLKIYSTIIPNQALNLNGSLTPLLTNQTVGGAASSDRRIYENLSASECEDVNENEENPGYSVDHMPFLGITDNKTHDGLTKTADTSVVVEEPIQERRPPLTLNNRICRCLVGPKTVVNDVRADLQYRPNNNFNKLQIESNKCRGEKVHVRKKVRFSEKVEELHQKRKLPNLETSNKRYSSVRPKKQRVSKSLMVSEPHVKLPVMNYCRKVVKEFIFRGTEFLLTGLSSQKEKDMESLIRNSGGVVLFDIPSLPNSRCKRSSTVSHLQLPIILCLKKMQTTKFLYGCAVGASILKVDWLTDCLASGTILQPEKYMILPNRDDMRWTRIGTAVHHRDRKHIFERVGIMLHGKHSFCSKLAVIIKHGGGQMFKTLQTLVRSTDIKRTLVAAIVAEDTTTISRHLKHCALEGGVPMMPYSWIVKSLYSGKLLTFTEVENSSPSPFERVPKSVNVREEM